MKKARGMLTIKESGFRNRPDTNTETPSVKPHPRHIQKLEAPIKGAQQGYFILWQCHCQGWNKSTLRSIRDIVRAKSYKCASCGLMFLVDTQI